jgi:multidrug efflux pump subunit AcrB
MSETGIANLFYRYPRLTLLAMGFILLVGISSLMNLGRQEDPTMTERYAHVQTLLAGASATRVESLVTEKLETALREIPEIKKLESVSRTSFSSVSIELYDSVSADKVDLVWSEIRDKLGEVAATLPQGTIAPDLEVSGPVAVTLAVSISGDQVPLSVLTRIAQELKSRLSNLANTRETEMFGEVEEEILVEANAFALGQINLSILELSQLIAASDTRISAGKFENSKNSLVVEVKGELNSIERIKSIPIKRHGQGSVVRIGDIATVSKFQVDPPSAISLTNGQRAIVVTTMMETGTRVDHWTARAKELVRSYQSELPTMVKLDIIIDQNYYTTERLDALFSNLLMAVLIVLGVLFFLMGIRSALIVGISLPLTMAMVLGGLNLLDIPLHQMSVTGLIISLGLLIDNAIVVVEEYKLSKISGDGFAAAISKSIHHLFIPLLASTVTTALAFLPIALTPGGIGDFTGAMAVSVILSVASSFILAMTVIPSLAAYLDQKFPGPIHNVEEEGRWWVNGFTHQGISTMFRRSVAWCLANPFWGVSLALVLPISGFVLSQQLTMSFFPPVDRNQFQIQVTLPAHSSIQETMSRVSSARAILASHDQIVSDHWFIGEGAPRVYYNMMSGNDRVASFANAFVTTRHVDDPREILLPLQKELMRVFPDARILATPFEQGPPFSAPIELRIIGNDLAELKELGDEMRLILSETSGVTYTTSSLANSVPQLSVYPNENMVNLLGLRNIDIPTQLQGELTGNLGGSVMEGNTELPVRVRYQDRSRDNLAEFDSLPIMSSSPFQGYAGIPLEQIAEIALEPSATRIDRHQGERLTTVSGYLLPYTYPSIALKDFRNRLENSDILLPDGYRIEFGGEEEERGDAMGSIASTFVMFVWLMVAVIVLSLNSFRYAGIIGLVGFLSIGLALFGVWLSGYPMGYMPIIGTLGLVGLAINGAIIVLSALKSNSHARAADVVACTDIVLNSSRHIVSTTVTTIGGFIPLIVFGGHFWPPLAMAIAGGVAGSALLALYLVPSLFIYYARKDMRKNLISSEALIALPDQRELELIGRKVS